MATTLNEIIYNIKSLVRGHSDDFIIPDAQIVYWANTERAVIMDQYFRNERYISQDLIQTLKCVPIECADPIDCCNVGLFSEKTILRTRDEIPLPFVGFFSGISNHALITYVGTVDRETPFEFTSESISRWSKYTKYSKYIPKAFFLNKRIYITNFDFPNQMGYISISGIFENPEQVSEFNIKDCDTCNLDFYNDPYPITPHLLSILYDVIFRKYFPLLLPSSIDKTNNANDDIKR